MTRDELIQAVAAKMDEITPSSAIDVTVDGADNNPLYELILNVIDDAALELYTIAPFWMVPYTTVSYTPSSLTSEIKTDTIFTGTEYERTILRIRLPAEFLRIAQITHTSFSRPITEVYPEQSAQAKRQHNRHLVGKTDRPVAVMSYGTWYNGNDKEIQCYSLPKGTQLVAGELLASYIKKPATMVTASSTPVAVPSSLLPALEWLVAAKAFSARGDVNHAAVCQQNAQNLLV